ncbi:angiopoietin-4-like [Drosophila albomicans]|uniref:Angiopoietin-4-like n=1 Tax=Drosophila albomicans TaxID=7291 RepID=A0A9C6WD19_DROAB|nr:angiopoietin-4-like [Drosophila albomicans]
MESLLKIQKNDTSLVESGNNKINQQNSKQNSTCLNSVNELQQENTKLNSQLQNNTMEITYLKSQLHDCKLNDTNCSKYNHDQQILLDQCQKSKEDMQKEIEDRKIIQNELNDCKNYSSHIENQLTVTQLNLTDLQAELAKKIQEKPVTILPKSCLNLSPGIQEIQLPNNKSCNVLCDDDGWMIIQRRINGKQDFDKKWQEYVDGFGELDGDFWFGLEKLHLVTSSMATPITNILIQQSSQQHTICINSVSEQQQENTKLKLQLQQSSNEIKEFQNQINACQVNSTNFEKRSDEKIKKCHSDQNSLVSCRMALISEKDKSYDKNSEMKKLINESEKIHEKLVSCQKHYGEKRIEAQQKTSFEKNLNDCEKKRADIENNLRRKTVKLSKAQPELDNCTSIKDELLTQLNINNNPPSSCLNLSAGIHEI